jgi:hypothetical protein
LFESLTNFSTRNIILGQKGKKDEEKKIVKNSEAPNSFRIYIQGMRWERIFKAIT